ncbi:hypothetical protein [Pedobacter alpinus]|uniref:Uncharacterized protein n=1 Tax=Pedobacter alpinus TaxID=1590643 RepID=A0ABW5TY71_9SPHI
MKKIIKLLIIVMVMMTGVQVSYGQNFTALFGTWRPSTPITNTQYTKITFVNLIANTKAKISDANNNHIEYNLKAIPNGGLETLLPIEIKKLYGYDAKKVFVRLYNQNNRLRVVRKVYEYDRNGTLLNSNPTIDSIIYEKAIFNNNLNPNKPTNLQPGNLINNGTIIKKYLDVNEDGTNKKLPIATSYNITNVKFQTLYVDDDKDCNKKTSEFSNNKAEFFGDIKIKIFKSATALNSDLGRIFSQYFKGNLFSSYFIELNALKLSTETYKSNFQVASADYNQTRIVFFGKLMEINPLIDGESGCETEIDYLLGSKNGDSSKDLYLKDLVNGDNYIDLKTSKNTMRIHFTIKPN